MIKLQLEIFQSSKISPSIGHKSLIFLGGCSIECIGLLCSLNNPTTISFIRDFKLNFNLKSSGQMVKNIFVLHQIVILADKGGEGGVQP